MGHEHAQHTMNKGDRGVLIIGIFKLLKSLFFVGVGFGALHFIHHDLVETLQHLVDSRGFDPENRFVSLVIDKAELVTHHRLRQITYGTFGYAAVAMVEGIGLIRRKVWAEYLTLWLSISFLPWELYELVFHPNWWRLAILVTNVLIVVYLVWVVRQKKRT
ncbi:MAG: DUF2127 domain-containing protein [Acidobacteria bacterium]|nr:DUF2127 domain-containing protein [Acidobacteriota bacterium]